MRRRDNEEEILLPAESILYALQRNWDMVDVALEGLDGCHGSAAIQRMQFRCLDPVAYEPGG